MNYSVTLLFLGKFKQGVIATIIQDSKENLCQARHRELSQFSDRSMVNLESPTAHSVDMMISYCVPSFDDAIALLCKFHGAWQCQTEMNDEV